MKESKRLFVVLGIGLGLLLAACGGQTSGSGGGGGGTTVTLRQQDSGPLVGAYYRVGGGSWQPITFSGGQATFTATGEYEVAVRCQSGSGVTDLHFFKAAVRQATALSFACEASSAGTSSRATFNVTLPRSIGSQAVQPGDAVFVGTGSEVYQGSNPVSVTTYLPDGRQDVLLTLLRATGGPPPTSLTPIGYKLAQNLNVSSGATYDVDDTGWQPFAATRSIGAVSLPSGYQGFAMVFFFRDGMKEPGIVGGIDRYGTLALSGKYLGMALAEPSTGSGSGLFALKDTGGADWTPSLMSPWGAGQFSVDGDTLTFAHPQAQTYLFQASGLLKDSASGSALKVHITVYPSGATTTYTVPVVPGLGYALENPTARSVSFDLTAYRGNLAQAAFLFGGGTLTESDLAGLDVALAQTSRSFNGPSYTLP